MTCMTPLQRWLLASAHKDAKKVAAWVGSRTPDEAWRDAPPDYLVVLATEPGVLRPRERERFAAFMLGQAHSHCDPKLISQTWISALGRWEKTGHDLPCHGAYPASSSAAPAQAAWLREHAIPNWSVVEETTPCRGGGLA